MLLHQLLSNILLMAKKLTLSLMPKTIGLKSNMKMLIRKPRRRPWVLHIMVGILGFSLKFLQPSVERKLSQLLLWLMVSLLALVNLLCSLLTDKVGSTLGNGRKLLENSMYLMNHKMLRIFWDLHLNMVVITLINFVILIKLDQTRNQ